MLDRISSGNEPYIISGLRAFKSIICAFEFEINQDRKPLETLVEVFFPVIECSILANNSFMQSSNYVPTMVLISKIFFMCN